MHSFKLRTKIIVLALIKNPTDITQGMIITTEISNNFVSALRKKHL